MITVNLAPQDRARVRRWLLWTGRVCVLGGYAALFFADWRAGVGVFLVTLAPYLYDRAGDYR